MAEHNCVSQDWTDLGESKVIGVIFSGVQPKYSSLDSIVCHIEVSDAVLQSPENYVGIFPAGSTDQEGCVLIRRVLDTDSRSHDLIMKPAGVPASFNGYYQLAYVGEDGIMYGKSIPFDVDKASPDTSVIDEDFLIIDPPLDEATIPYEEYKKALDRVAKLEEENEALSKTMRVCQKGQERTIFELEQVFQKKCEKYHNEIDKLTKDKAGIAEQLPVLKCQLGDALEENSQLKCYIKSQKQMLKNYLNAQKEKKEPSPQSSPTSGNSPVGTANFLQNELSDHECMIRALEDSKKLCLEELQNEKHARLEVEIHVEKLKNEYKVLLEKYTSLLEYRNQETKIMLEKLNKLQDDMKLSRDELNKKLENLNIENKSLVVASENLQDHVKNLESMNQSLVLENEELKKQKLEESVTNSESLKEIEDMKVRLEEAAELYKSQYVEIHKLKKIATKFSLISGKSDDNSTEKKSDTLQQPSTSTFSQSPINDSDTGETVSSNFDFELFQDTFCRNAATCAKPDQQLTVSPAPSAPVELIGEAVPTVASRSESWPEFYIVSCPSCTEVFPVVNNDNTTLQDHLSVTHQQQLCPVCYMVFDGTVASKLMKRHIESHFEN